MDSSGSAIFHPGVRGSAARRNPPRIRLVAAATQPPVTLHPPWEERIMTLSAPGKIRLLDPPLIETLSFLHLWMKDMSLTEWIETIDAARKPDPIASAMQPADYLARMERIFATNQRKRWLARAVLRRWTQRVWLRKTQCNIDMIDMAPVSDADAILLTDTKHRMIFRFHRRDVFKNLLTNICMSDEMLPTPRYPTNPWTNSKLTMAQTMGLCQQLATDYGRRGQCPPVLFAAFWAARFNLKRFLEENSSTLAQHAVTSFFKDLHEHNSMTVLDTIVMLLTYAGLNYSLVAIRRWLAQTPITPLHREWLAFVRDYTLYINLHAQVRANWITEEHIYVDVRRLYARTVLPDVTSQRMGLLRSTQPHAQIPAVPAVFGLVDLPILLHDPSSNAITETLAFQLIQNVLNQF